jgi:hypothetical protein
MVIGVLSQALQYRFEHEKKSVKLKFYNNNFLKSYNYSLNVRTNYANYCYYLISNKLIMK